MTLGDIRRILDQARELESVEWIYLEGGEPFLYYPILLRAAREAGDQGFKVGMVTNAFWATTREDAEEWLRPLAGLLGALSVSGDLYHASDDPGTRAENAVAAAEKLEIPVGMIRIAQPEEANAAASHGQLPEGVSAVLYRGRAAEKLFARASMQPWWSFSECTHEELRDPGRVHVDPLGNVHICQGICIGNMFRTPLREICESYEPDAHPIVGPLLEGGPAELVRRYGLEHEESYADECHLCDRARDALRERFPEELCPDQMYTVVGEEPADEPRGEEP
jgi:MoaA/NifB/PqqE/SkfB family radical SAM enzyme